MNYIKFSQKFNLKGPFEFFDPILGRDEKYFIDPYLIYKSKQEDEISQRCSDIVVSYFRQLLNAAKKSDKTAGYLLVRHLHEIRETHLGYSNNSNKGKGIGENKGMELFNIISNSDAVETGLVRDIFDTSIMLSRVSYDKVSDLTANMILVELITFTQDVCKKRNIPMEEVNFNKYIWDCKKNNWVYKKTLLLPTYAEYDKKIGIILIPQKYVRKVLAYNINRFYNEIMIPFYEKDALKHPSYGLVKMLKDGKPKVYRSKIRQLHPCTKKNVNDFIRRNRTYYFDYKEKILNYAELNNI